MNYEDICHLLLKSIVRALDSIDSQNYGNAKQILQAAQQQAEATRRAISNEHLYPIE